MSRGRIVVLGVMGQSPFAGVGWQVLHYLEGCRRLGYDTYYVEDTGEWPYDPVQNTITDDCRYTVGYLARLLERCELGGAWVYRNARLLFDQRKVRVDFVSLVFLGDLVSIYAAVLRGADPVAIPAIDALKAQLSAR